MIVKMLQAQNGDCFIISYSNEDDTMSNIVIDGGPASAFRDELKSTLLELNNKGIDLLILTHPDDDHIGGLLRFFSYCHNHECNVKKVLYNSPKVLAEKFGTAYNIENEIKIYNTSKNHSQAQAISLDYFLEQNGLFNNNLVHCETDPIYIGDAKIIILSPTMDQLERLNAKWKYEKETCRNHRGVNSDHQKSIEQLQNEVEEIKTSITNESSITFLMEYKNNRLLFLGDSSPSVIVSSLGKLGYSKEKKIHIDYVKLSHHGSKYNTSYELLDRIECENYLVSTDGTRNNHPDKETFAKIINKKDYDLNFYFNYTHNDLFTKEEKDKYNFKYFKKQEFTL